MSPRVFRSSVPNLVILFLMFVHQYVAVQVNALPTVNASETVRQIYLPIINNKEYQPRSEGTIAFISSRDENHGEIYTMKPDGSEVTRLTFNDWLEESPAWSPSGEQIAFRKNGFLYVMHRDGRLQRLLATPGDASYPAWSPDGQRIAFVNQYRDIYLINADGSNPMRLAEFYSAEAPSWSPDGRRLAFSAFDPSNGSSCLYVMTIVDKKFSCIADGGNPAWSPDGQHIAFDGVEGIYVMKPDGTQQTLLTNNQGFASDPTWSPDGKRIAFVAEYASSAGIFIMNADGTQEVNITNDEYGGTFPAWSSK